MKKRGSSSRWLAEHGSDEYVKLARAQGYRSRAAFKLLEIDKKYRLLEPGMLVVDLGAAPGSWSQVAARKTGAATGKGRVIASDILPMAPVEGVQFLQGDFTDRQVLEGLSNLVDKRAVDLVISDMAPNSSGIKEIDQPRSICLVELALEFSGGVLKRGGKLVTKVFEGDGTAGVRRAYRRKFEGLVNFKPASSRAGSRELYLIGRGFAG